MTFNFKRLILSVVRGQPNIAKLKKRGLKVGDGLWTGNYCFIDYSHCFLITIGDNCTLCARTSILAHDASTKKHIGYTKIGKVTIGNNVFIGVGSIVLPGVTIGDNAIIGAGSVVSKSIPANEVWVGNPVRFVSTLDTYLAKFEGKPKFEEDYRLTDDLDEDKKEEMRKTLENGIGLIR